MATEELFPIHGTYRTDGTYERRDLLGCVMKIIFRIADKTRPSLSRWSGAFALC